MNNKKCFINLERYRDFLLVITVYTFYCMLVGSTTITWNTVAINFGLLIAVVIISLFFNRGKMIMKIGFLGLLTLVFIVLKLTHYIDWSWVLVLSPLWLGWLVVTAILFVLTLIGIGKTKMKAKNKSFDNSRCK